MKFIAIAAAALFGFASELAADTVADDTQDAVMAMSLEEPIVTPGADGGASSAPVNTRDRFGEADEGATSPMFSESSGE